MYGGPIAIFLILIKSNKKMPIGKFGMQQTLSKSNYSQPAIEAILAYSKQEAHKDFFTEERGKCLCYTSSLLFFTSNKLHQKVKSLRKYLSKKSP